MKYQNRQIFILQGQGQYAVACPEVGAAAAVWVGFSRMINKYLGSLVYRCLKDMLLIAILKGFKANGRRKLYLIIFKGIKVGMLFKALGIFKNQALAFF